MYTHPLMSFIDHHCAVFDDEDENKLEYTSIHAEFKRLVETLLSEFLVEVGVPPARFVQVVADSAGGELNDFVLGSILTVDDFVQFKAMMVRRNVQLTEEVLELHRARADAQAAAAAAAADASSSPAPSTPDPATEHPPTSPLDRSVDDDGFHRGALAQAEASSAASAADLDALATNLERDARRAAEISAREAALARAVPEFEDDTTAPEPDDGFDEGALEQAMKLSEAQFEADAIAKRDRATRRAEEASAAATKAAATAEAARAMADAAAATERAVLAQARADPNYDAGLLPARAESAEAAAKAAEAAAKAAEAAETTDARGVEGGASNDEYHDELRRAMEESAADAAREAEEADRERRELEEAMAASLALAESSRESSGASGSGNPPSVTSSPATKHAAGLVDRLGKAPLGSSRGAAAATTGLPPVAGALRPLQKIAPATNVAAGKGSGALRGAGYKPPGVHAGSGVDAGVAAVVPGSDFRRGSRGCRRRRRVAESHRRRERGAEGRPFRRSFGRRGGSFGGGGGGGFASRDGRGSTGTVRGGTEAASPRAQGGGAREGTRRVRRQRTESFREPALRRIRARVARGGGGGGRGRAGGGRGAERRGTAGEERGASRGARQADEGGARQEERLDGGGGGVMRGPGEGTGGRRLAVGERGGGETVERSSPTRTHLGARKQHRRCIDIKSRRAARYWRSRSGALRTAARSVRTSAHTVLRAPPHAARDLRFVRAVERTVSRDAPLERDGRRGEAQDRRELARCRIHGRPRARRPGRRRDVRRGGGGGGADHVRRFPRRQGTRRRAHRHRALVLLRRRAGEGTTTPVSPPRRGCDADPNPTRARARPSPTSDRLRPHLSPSLPKDIVTAVRRAVKGVHDDIGRNALLLHAKRDLYMVAFQGVVDLLKRSEAPDTGAILEAIKDIFKDLCDDWRELVDQSRRDVADVDAEARETRDRLRRLEREAENARRDAADARAAPPSPRTPDDAPTRHANANASRVRDKPSETNRRRKTNRHTRTRPDPR